MEISFKQRLTFPLILLYLFFLPVSLFAQAPGTQAAGIHSGSTSGTDTNVTALSLKAADLAAEANAQLALSVPNYRVTAGDIYNLAFMSGTGLVQYTIPVDSTYKIRIANMGVIDAAARNFSQLKAQVETIVANNYPMSGVQFVLSKPAVFKVYVRGEVTAAKEVTAWALNRLSSLTADNLTPRTSLRDVTVRSSNGQTRVFDLFRAQRLGELEQDPYLRPDDVVTFNRSDRGVTVLGAVERPGTYQLMAGENIKELIEFYGGGFTPVADRTRVEIQRQVNSIAASGDKIFLAEKDIGANFPLHDFDSIMVPSITSLSPVMFLEGAINTGNNADDMEGLNLTVSTRAVVPFSRGENYAALVRRYRNWFTAVSDTRNVYIIRGEEHIPLNLNPMLYDAEFRSDTLVQENDTLIIPFRQYFVTVAGAVLSPGRYPYIPDRQWDYYVALAGGFAPGRNTREAVDIFDIQGNRVQKSDVIGPETIITARTNHALYYFNQYAPVITTALTVVTTFLSLQAYFSSR